LSGQNFLLLKRSIHAEWGFPYMGTCYISYHFRGICMPEKILEGFRVKRRANIHKPSSIFLGGYIG